MIFLIVNKNNLFCIQVLDCFVDLKYDVSLFFEVFYVKALGY